MPDTNLCIQHPVLAIGPEQEIVSSPTPQAGPQNIHSNEVVPDFQIAAMITRGPPTPYLKMFSDLRLF